MSAKAKTIAKKAAKTGIWTVSDIVFLILKTMCTVLLIAVTTGILFACFFVMYIRANLISGLDVNPSDFSMSLSSVICYIDPATGRERELVTLQSTEFRLWVDYADIPEHMIDALVAIEDHRFFRHNGVDWYRSSGAFLNMFLGMRDTFGGSTITQQLIKNLTSEDDVTVQRKLMEIFRAIEYEKHSKKEDILELYLNLVYFGHGCYGIGAAADYYFGKEVSQLTLPESAAIIGTTNNPSLYSPYANRSANKSRQEDILFRMRELGYISTEEEFRKLVNEPLNFTRGENSAAEQVIYTWFEEAVINDVIADMMSEKGFNEALARRYLFTQGYKIIATIDPDIQRIVDDVYLAVDSLPAVTGSSAQIQSGVVIADHQTGEIKALSGGVGAKTRNMLLNRATMTQRPPGSSLKPLSAYAPAMDKGILTPTTLYEDSADVTLSGTTWMPRNAVLGDYRGIVDVRTAILLSLNTTPAIIIDQLTPTASFSFLRDSLGFNLHPEDENYAPLAAGQLTNGATVREMASGFTIFPNSGERMELHTYSAVYDAYGMLFLDNSAKSNRAISRESAYWMTEMLYGAVLYGTGREANLGSMPTAGKTGTSSDSEDRWFVGFTPYYVAAVWTGYDMPARMTVSGNPSAQIWKRLMEPVHEGLDPKPFYPFDSSTYYLLPVQGLNTVEYTVRCVDTDGNVLHEETSSALAGREVTEQAADIEGYVLISDPEVTLTVSVNPARNVLLFTYESEEPEDPEDPEDAEGPEDGEGPDDSEDPGAADNPYWPYSPYGTYPPYGPGNPYSPENPYGPDHSYGPFNPYDPDQQPDPGQDYDPFAPGDGDPPEDWTPPPDPEDTLP